MKFEINSDNLSSSEAFGFIICYYMYDAENVKEIVFNDLPDRIKEYYWYVDSEERKEFTATLCLDTRFIVADWKGDRYVTDNKRNACSPNFYMDNVWSFLKTAPSLRFELDLAEKNTEDNDYDNWEDDDWGDDDDD